MTRYKLEKIWKIDKAALSREQALTEAKEIWKLGNKNLMKINVVEKRDGVQNIIKIYQKRRAKKTEKQKL